MDVCSDTMSSLEKREFGEKENSIDIRINQLYMTCNIYILSYRACIAS
jgi:hypothetical protein